MNIRFSMIIPCYNVEKYIEECLDSILSQEEQSWEAICVDDGSTDESGAILDKYASRDSRIRVIHQENKGLSEARNAALKVANGEWLYYLDSDDLLPPTVLSKISSSLKLGEEVDMVWGKLTSFDDGLKPKWREEEQAPESVVDVANTLFLRHFATYFQTFLFRRAVFGEIPFVGDSWCEERPYVAKCMARARKIMEVGYYTYCFRRRDGSITHSKMRLEHCNGYLNATIDMFRILTSSGKRFEPALRRMLLTDCMEWTPQHIVTLLPRGYRKEAWNYWFASLGEVKKYGPMTIWRRFTLFLCSNIKFRCVPILLCVIPDWLKRCGLHR